MTLLLVRAQRFQAWLSQTFRQRGAAIRRWRVHALHAASQ
jgi:hypothetical protein